jgi:hypothetical protein
VRLVQTGPILAMSAPVVHREHVRAVLARLARPRHRDSLHDVWSEPRRQQLKVRGLAGEV